VDLRGQHANRALFVDGGTLDPAIARLSASAQVRLEGVADDLGARPLRPGGPGVKPVEQIPGHAHPHLR
jgi:hypothetical protein